MIKTLKKFSKKSLAILIALLMIISVMPFTPPISVEAADGYEVLGKVTIDPIIYTHGKYNNTPDSEYAYMNYGSTIADGSYDGECKTAVKSTLPISSVEAVGVSGASVRVEKGLLKGTLGSTYEGKDNADKTVTLKFNFSDGTYEYHKMPVKTNPVAQHVAGFSQRQNTAHTFKRGISFEMLAVGSYGQTNEGSYSATSQANNTSATRNFKKMYAPFNKDGSVGAYCTKDKFYGLIDSYITTDKQCGYAARNRKQEIGTDVTLTVNSKKGYYYLDKSADTNYGIIKENNKYYVDVLVGKIYNDFDDDSISYNNRSVSGVSESKIIDISNITSITETKQAKETDQRGYIRCEITNPSAGSTIEANTSIKYQSDHNVYAALVLNLPFDIQITDKSNTRNLYKDYIKNLDPRCYTAETWETFRNALLTAEEFLNDNTDNSSDATAKSNLENAKKKLALNEDNSVHTHYTSKVTTQPTCTTAGVTTYTCSCGHSYTDNTTPAAKGHTEVTDEAVAPTCTKTGLTQGKHCSVCGEVLKEQQVVEALGHNYTYKSIDSAYHSVTCSRNCGEKDWTYTEAHTMNGNTCSKCGYVSKVTITFVDKDGKSTSAEYTIGATVEIPALPPTEYTYNNDETHTETTYSWNSEPNPVAHDNATYQVIATNSEPVACNFVLKDSTTVDGKTIDTLECSVCKGTINKTVADMSALNHAIEQLEALVNADGANYKYEATALDNAKKALNGAKDFVQKADKYALQSDVDKQASTVNETITTLTTTGLAQYTVTFNLVNGDTGETIETASSKMKYGDIAEKTYTFEKDEDGFPEYVVCKWTVGDAKLNTTDTSISGVVKGNATYICYVLPFKATNETQNTTRVRYLDKSGNTLKIAYAQVGSNYQIDSSVSIPKIPYYKFTKWERVYGEDNPVGTREVVYQARYKYDEVEANNCTIVGLGGVSVNGSSSCTSRYDDKVVLTGATKYAFCDSTGKKIISYINADYIYTPHINGTVYITKVETASTEASTAVTGHFTQLNTGTTTGGTPINTLYVNAQYYLPEGATAVEAGIVISSQQKTTETLVIGGAGVIKVISDTQGTNHEYSIGMTYTKSGTLYTRSYLICILSDGTTKTVYSDDVTEVKL